MPPSVIDAAFGRKAPVPWQSVRAAVFAVARTLNTGEGLRDLYDRMAAQLTSADTRDLGLVIARAAARSLIRTVADDVPAQAYNRIVCDQDQRLAMMLASPDFIPTRGGSLRSAWNEYRIGGEVRRLIRRRLRSKDGGRTDLLSGILPLAPKVGVTRTAYTATTLLTAIAGAPGPVAACLAFELASRAAWRRRLRMELAALRLDDLFASPVRSAPETHGFVREVLRLWSFPLMARRVVKKAMIVEGHPLQPGEAYVFSTFLPHRDPHDWPDPDSFRPERWRQDECRRPGSYVPFGWGVRTCPGAAIGLSHLILLTHLLTVKFDIDVSPESNPTIELANVAWPRNFFGRLVTSDCV